MTTLPRHLSHSTELKQFARFLAVGALGTLLDFCLLTLLKHAGASTLAANTTGFVAGFASNYFFNSRWTFAEANTGWKQFVRFACVSLAGLVMNNLIVLGLEDPLGILIGNASSGYLPAKVVATGLIVLWNYGANRLWTFRTRAAD